jgi:hypothetical protein
MIFDISRGMQSKEDAVQQIASGFVQSGANGQMRRGDTLGIWFFNDSLIVGQFPLQEWRPESAHEIAHKLIGVLHTVPYQKDGHLETVTPDMNRIIKNSDFITVVILSDGSSEISGTDCDGKINASFREWRKSQQKSKMPFIIVLRAARGTITDCTVTTPPFPLELPRPSPELVSLRTPPVAKVQPVQMGAPLIVSGRTQDAPIGQNIIMGNGTARTESAPTVPAAQPNASNSDPAPAPTASPAPMASPAPTTPFNTELTVLARPTEVPAASPSSEATPAEPRPTAVKSEPVQTRTEASTSTAVSGENSAGTVLPAQNAVASVPPPLYLQKHIWIGAGGVFVGVLIGVAVLSRGRSRSSGRISLITRSLDKEQK